jgi:hypothetical protein
MVNYEEPNIILREYLKQLVEERRPNNGFSFLIFVIQYWSIVKEGKIYNIYYIRLNKNNITVALTIHLILFELIDLKIKFSQKITNFEHLIWNIFY